MQAVPSMGMKLEKGVCADIFWTNIVKWALSCKRGSIKEVHLMATDDEICKEYADQFTHLFGSPPVDTEEPIHPDPAQQIQVPQ